MTILSPGCGIRDREAYPMQVNGFWRVEGGAPAKVFEDIGSKQR